MMRIDFAEYSGCGGRPVNEDSRLCMENCFVIADGLGGHDNGETASAAVVNYFRSSFSGVCSDEETARLISGADEAVRTNGDGGKSTLAAIFAEGTRITYCNIGDSRVYYFRNGSIIERSRDHSVCQASVDMGDMKETDVRNSDDRSGLFKVLGGDTPVKLPKPYKPIEARDGDAFLICSDGFWEYVYEMEMEADLLKSANAQEWLRHMLKRQILRAQDNGDNYTAVCGIISIAENPGKKSKKLVSLPVLLVCLGLCLAGLGAFAAMKLLPAGNSEHGEAGAVTSEAASGDISEEITEESPAIASKPAGSDEPELKTSEPEPPASAEPVPSETAEPTETTAQPTEASEPSETTAQSAEVSEPSDTTAQPAETSEPSDTTAQSAEVSEPTETTAQPAEASEPSDTTAQTAEASKPPETTAQPAETTVPVITPEPTGEAIIQNLDR